MKLKPISKAGVVLISIHLYFVLSFVTAIASGTEHEETKSVAETPSLSMTSSPGYTDPVTGMEFVAVPGGCFEMGNASGSSQEKPVHEVCVDGFLIGKFEVTQGQWQKIMGNSNIPTSLNKGDNYPIDKVSWSEAQAFITKFNWSANKYYRLPTEAEWEYAARSGGKHELYAGGDNVDAVAWYSDNSGGTTHPVGMKSANGLGIYDMSGNVWEWCQDWFGEIYYKVSPKNNPTGPKSGPGRVARGGSWDYGPKVVRATNRYWLEPSSVGVGFGFRLVLPQVK